MRTLAMVVALFSLFASAPAGADDGFRCSNGRLVSVGDGMKQVRDRCGDPDYVTTRIERRKVKHRYTRWVGNVQESVVEEQEIEVPIDEWTYDLGPAMFIRYVTFEGGHVVNVTTGEYGHKQ